MGVEIKDPINHSQKAKVDAQGNLQVTHAAGSSGAQGSLTDRSGSITTGGTSQQLAAANAVRKYLFVQNLSAEALWINFGVAAVADQPSIKLPASGDSFVMEAGFLSTQAVNILGATTGSKFSAKEGG